MDFRPENKDNLESKYSLALDQAAHFKDVMTTVKITHLRLQTCHDHSSNNSRPHAHLRVILFFSRKLQVRIFRILSNKALVTDLSVKLNIPLFAPP